MTNGRRGRCESSQAEQTVLSQRAWVETLLIFGCFVVTSSIASGSSSISSNAASASSSTQSPGQSSNQSLGLARRASSVKPMSSWHGSLSYEINTDFAAQQEQRQYLHTLTPEVAYKLSPSHSFGVDAPITYQSLDNEIEKKDGAFEFEDVRLVHTYSTTVYSSPAATQNLTPEPHLDASPVGPTQTIISAKNIKKTNLSINTSLSLPTSAQAHYEGYLGILSSTAALSHPLVLRKLNMRTSVTWSYLANTYESSPVTSHENNDHSFAYGLGLSLMVWGPLNFQINGSVKTAHSISGDWTYRYNNSERLSVAMGKWNTSLTFLNGNYAKSDRFNPFFYDEYRQITTLEIGYEL